MEEIFLLNINSLDFVPVNNIISVNLTSFIDTSKYKSFEIAVRDFSVSPAIAIGATVFTLNSSLQIDKSYDTRTSSFSTQLCKVHSTAPYLFNSELLFLSVNSRMLQNFRFWIENSQRAILNIPATITSFEVSILIRATK